MTNQDQEDETQDTHPFTYIKPNEEQTDRIRYIRTQCKALHTALLATLPPSRQRSLAITKLEELSMWANKGIAFHPARGDNP